jgi:hypothetical protein
MGLGANGGPGCNLMAGPPSNFDVFMLPSRSRSLSWINESAYTYMNVQRKKEGDSYSTIDTVTYPAENYEDTSMIFLNTRYYYRIATNEGNSDEDSCVAWFVDPDPDTVSMSDTTALALSVSITATDSFSLGDATEVEHQEGGGGEPQNYDVTESDTMTMSDSYETSLISGQNWMYYLGSDAGAVYPYDADFLGDDDADITSYYQSKALDFHDQHPEWASAWKTISRVYLDYVDKGEIPITIWISTDNGSTWVSNDRTIGNGSHTVKTERFDFWVSGRFFIFKISHASNDRNFQWVRLKIEYFTQGERF